MLFHPTRFWNFMAKGYARGAVKDQSAYQHKLDVTARYLKPDDRLLEFGCGTGTTALLHAPRVAHIDAIDFSSEMIAIARQKADEEEITNIRFETAAFEDWQPADGSYDAVLGMSILHLVTDLDATLASVNAVLKPGGRFFSSTVCLGDMGGLTRYFLPPLGAIGLLPKISWLTPEILSERHAAHRLIVEQVWCPKSGAAVFIVAQKPG